MADEEEKKENKESRSGTDRRQLSLDDIFGGEEIDWSKLGLTGDRRKGSRRGIEARGTGGEDDKKDSDADSD